MRKLSGASAWVVAAGLLLTTGAFAQDTGPSTGGGMDAPGGLYDKSPHDRKGGLTVWGILGYGGFYGTGFGVGARYQMPLLKDGFLDGLNDSVELEFGGDVLFAGYFGYSVINIDVPVEGLWTFHLFPKFDIYAKLGLGLDVELSSYAGAGIVPFGLYYNFATGANYKLSDAMSLRLELGYRGVKFGVKFDF